MKKSLIVILAVIMVMACLFTGCQPDEPTEPVVTPKVAGVPDEPAAATKSIDVTKTVGKEYTTIEFGRYPSTELDAEKDADLIAALDKISESEMDTKTGYFTYEDAEYRKELKIVKDPETGVDVTEVHWFKVVPIVWNVLNEADGKMLVIAADNVDTAPFNTTPENTNWAVSTLRDWMNGLNDYKNGISFYNSAFNADEQAVILTQDVTTEKNPSYGTESGVAVKDRVSLLSIEDLADVSGWSVASFAADEDGATLLRACGNTDYAIFKGAAPHVSYDRRNASWWWLRNSGANEQQAAYVNEVGVTIDAGYTVSFPQNSVRPTLVLDTAHLNITEA